MEGSSLKKVPIGVEVTQYPLGREKLQAIIWKDGQRFRIDRVLHSCPSFDHEYEGIRYTVLISSAEKYIYKAGTEWYVLA
jgi:hypothetical protein